MTGRVKQVKAWALGDTELNCLDSSWSSRVACSASVISLSSQSKKKNTFYMPITLTTARYNSVYGAQAALKLKTWQQIWLRHFERGRFKRIQLCWQCYILLCLSDIRESFPNKQPLCWLTGGKFLCFPEEGKGKKFWNKILRITLTLFAAEASPIANATRSNNAYVKATTLMCFGLGCVSVGSLFSCACVCLIFHAVTALKSRTYQRVWTCSPRFQSSFVGCQ